MTRLAALFLFLELGSFPSPKQNIAVVDDGHPICGAIMLSETLTLTAAHCVTDDAGVPETHVTVRCGSNDVTAKVVKSSLDEDLAALHLLLPCDEKRGFGTDSFSVLAFNDPPLGSQVHAIGYPGGDARLSRGIVSSYETSKLVGHDPHVVLVSDTRIFYGNSGGGLFNENNELVGIASQLDSAGYGYWIPVSSIHKFLDGI